MSDGAWRAYLVSDVIVLPNCLNVLYSTRVMRDLFGFVHDLDNGTIRVPSTQLWREGTIDVTDDGSRFFVPAAFHRAGWTPARFQRPTKRAAQAHAAACLSLVEEDVGSMGVGHDTMVPRALTPKDERTVVSILAYVGNLPAPAHRGRHRAGGLCPLVDRGEIALIWTLFSAWRAFWPPRCSHSPRSRAAATHQLRYTPHESRPARSEVICLFSRQPAGRLEHLRELARLLQCGQPFAHVVA